MSRAGTPVSTQPGNAAQNTQPAIPHEKIAMRAYEKWLKRGKQSGSQDADWLQAEAELRVEMTKGANGTSQQRR